MMKSFRFLSTSLTLHTIIIILTVCGISVTQNLTSTSKKGSPLLVVILSGFRWDYISDLPAFQRFYRNGTQARYLLPVFPSQSYPNLQSILTGLYPENHGIISDFMYEATTKTFFYGSGSSTGTTEPHWWNVTDNIYVLAANNQKVVQAYSLPGCDASIRGTGTTSETCRSLPQFHGVLSLDKDLAEVLASLDSGKADLAIVYSNYIIDRARITGPTSTEIKKDIKNVNKEISTLLNRVEDMGLNDKINIILVSDHGTTEINEKPEKHIQLESVSATSPKAASFDDIEFILSYGAFVGIYPKVDKINKVYEDLKQLEGLDIYKRGDIPETFHIKWNNRTAPMIAVAKRGYYIDMAIQSDKQHPPSNVDATIPNRRAADGYDPQDVHDMRGIFLARGPNFKQNVAVESVSAVDVYNMMTCVLNITGHQNNGSMATACQLLYNTQCNMKLCSKASINEIHYYLITCTALVVTMVSFKM